MSFGNGLRIADIVLFIEMMGLIEQTHDLSAFLQSFGAAHILLIMKSTYQVTIDDIDGFVYAENPDPSRFPVLHEQIKKHNLNGPCRPGMCLDEDGKCEKNFPKDFCNETILGEDSYPKYRRWSPQEGGFQVIKVYRGEDYVLDNRYVVPYNPFLSMKYKCHICIGSLRDVTGFKICEKVRVLLSCDLPVKSLERC